MADRYTYIPLIGLFIGLVWFMGDLFGEDPTERIRVGLKVVGPMVVFGLIALSFRQTAHWKDSKSLWEHAVSATRGNAIALSQLGKVMADSGRYSEALAHFRNALLVKPHLKDALLNMGDSLVRLGRFSEGERQLAKVLSLEPDDAEAHFFLAVAKARQGMLDDAVGHYYTAIRLRPEWAQAYYNLGLDLLSLGRVSESVGAFQKAIQYRPNYVKPYIYLGDALAQLGDMDEAVTNYRTALRLDPQSWEAQYRLQVLRNRPQPDKRD